MESSEKAIHYYDKKIRQKNNVPSFDNKWKIWYSLHRDRLARKALKLYITQK